MKRTKILVTGGNGFIGHHFCEHILKNTDWDIDIIDSMNYASMGYDRLKDVKVYDSRRVRNFSFNFTNRITGGLWEELKHVDYIVHMGAETHVDNSIRNPEIFVQTNVIGTMQMLEFARTLNYLQLFVYFSTDEVFGPAPAGVAYKEWDRYNSGNPYSASKAGGEELVLAWNNTYKIPALITHTMNVFGERQHPEKFIPSTIRKVLDDDTVIIHSDPSRRIAGSRSWIHARNVADAILWLINQKTGHSGRADKINIAGEIEIDNLKMAQMIAGHMGKLLKYEMVDFHSSRPGHDLRYALDGSKLADMGFTYPKRFDQSLKKTIDWTLNNSKWMR